MVAMAVVMLGLMFFIAVIVSESVNPSDHDWKRVEVAAVLRHTEHGWVQVDARHKSIGVSKVSVSEDGEHLVVSYETPWDVVYFGHISSDEYFTAFVPVRAGLSVGLDRTEVFFATPDGKLLRPDSLSSSGNFFFSASGAMRVGPEKLTPLRRFARVISKLAMRL